ncbi:MAG: C4-type zinc ribbon domain-containing protein [Treponema sp.]|nr:C4-type zinc ribbon domain-containing protein [Spirochaetia bacterium]MDY4901679.1 C4-type zinc ribbon domain-containing protein [Treponema sp.]
MEISEELDKLKALEKVLVQKYEIESEVAELPKSLDTDKEALERYKKEYIAISEEYNVEAEKASRIKAELDEAEKERESGEKEMDTVEQHRDYEILSKKINEAKERSDSLRKELVIEERKISELKDALATREAEINVQEEDVQQSQSSLDEKLESYKKQIADLSEEEKSVSEGIDEETIIKFQRIIKRNKEGVVALKGNVCDGCHMMLPAQFANEVRHGDKLLFCPYCSRILFYEEAEDTELANFSLNEAGSLADFEDELEDADIADIDSDEDTGDLSSSMDFNE